MDPLLHRQREAFASKSTDYLSGVQAEAWYAFVEEEEPPEEYEGGKIVCICSGFSTDDALKRYLVKKREKGTLPEWYRKNSKLFALQLANPQAVTGNTAGVVLNNPVHVPKIDDDEDY